MGGSVSVSKCVSKLSKCKSECQGWESRVFPKRGLPNQLPNQTSPNQREDFQPQESKIERR